MHKHSARQCSYRYEWKPWIWGTLEKVHSGTFTFLKHTSVDCSSPVALNDVLTCLCPTVLLVYLPNLHIIHFDPTHLKVTRGEYPTQCRTPMCTLWSLLTVWSLSCSWSTYPHTTIHMISYEQLFLIFCALGNISDRFKQQNNLVRFRRRWWFGLK